MKDILKQIYKKIPVIKTIHGVDYLGGYIDKQGIFHPIPGYEKIKIPNKKDNKIIKKFKKQKWDVLPALATRTSQM